MRKIFLAITILFSLCVSAQIDKVIPKRPAPPKLVNDFTNTLTDHQKEDLEQKLVKYDDAAHESLLKKDPVTWDREVRAFLK